jgi:hypothetical protein
MLHAVPKLADGRVHVDPSEHAGVDNRAELAHHDLHHSGGGGGQASLVRQSRLCARFAVQSAQQKPCRVQQFVHRRQPVVLSASRRAPGNWAFRDRPSAAAVSGLSPDHRPTAPHHLRVKRAR